MDWLYKELPPYIFSRELYMLRNQIMLWNEHDFTANGEVWWKKVESKSWCTFWDTH